VSSPERNAEAVARLDAVTRRLRRECPWDREQDERSIVPHTVEEAYELAEAAELSDDGKLLDELGDVLFQVHFLSLLLEEREAGDMATVAENCRAKLIRRHPHVFGEGGDPTTAVEVLRNWDRIKVEEEGGEATGPFGDLPENLPSLLYARKVQRRAASRIDETGLAPDALEAAGLARSAIAELEALAAEAGENPATRVPEIEKALGEALFALVDAARQLRCDPELALRAAAREFRAGHES